MYNLQAHAAAGEEALHQLAELDVVIDEQDRDPRLGLGRASPWILVVVMVRIQRAKRGPRTTRFEV
jgi:hypothetical protein